MMLGVLVTVKMDTIVTVVVHVVPVIIQFPDNLKQVWCCVMSYVVFGN